MFSFPRLQSIGNDLMLLILWVDFCHIVFQKQIAYFSLSQHLCEWTGELDLI